MAEDLVPRKRSDLWEPVLCVVWVHRKNLLSRGSTQDFNNLDELVNPAFAREDGLSKHELSDDTADRPHVDIGAVV